MSDVKSGETSSATGTLYLSDEALKQGLDLSFFAARDISAQGKGRFAEARLGHAHARVSHFIARKPGLSVAALLGFSKAAEPSPVRVLDDPPNSGFVERKPAMQDRRTRWRQSVEAGANERSGETL